MSAKNFLEVRDLHFSYTQTHEALRGVSFALSLESGQGKTEKLALVGPNGSGKSTLLLALAGAFTSANMTGMIFLDGHASTPDELRESVGLIFQESDDQLFMPSVLEDVAFGPVARGMPLETARDRARTTLELLGVGHLAERVPQRMSGGEKRMVALAGILVMSPRVIVLDEPTSSLDPRARRRVINVLRELETPIILATHDLDMAVDVCSRAMILHDGVIAASGALPELFRDVDLLKHCGLETPLQPV